MKDTTNIRPISELLARVAGRSTDEVKRKLDLGRLYSMRSALVHNGTLGVELEQLGPIMGKLEDICFEVIRSLVGLSYTGALDKYFSDPSDGN